MTGQEFLGVLAAVFLLSWWLAERDIAREREIMRRRRKRMR